jgi:hypothetical protein
MCALDFRIVALDEESLAAMRMGWEVACGRRDNDRDD